jgi:ribosomal protein S18 acetylase RimI-like enzyme
MTDIRHIIRRASVEDAPAISALVERAYTPSLAIVERRLRPMDDDFAERCASGHAYVLENSGDLLGAAIIEDMPGHLFLHNVAVDPERHSQGIGREIMHFVEDEARRRGFPEVQLTTLEGMVRNVSIYQRLGYVITGRLNAGKFNRVTMTKHLE